MKLLIVLILLTTNMSTVATQPAYRNPSLPVDRRVDDLLARMTLEEKVAQMVCVWNEKVTKLLDDQGGFDPARATEHFGHGHGIGQVGRPGDAHGGATPRDFAELTNAIQRFFVENSRLGIPVLFHDECLHGLVGRDATSFAQPIGLASTFNPELVRRLYEMTAREARACGVHQALGPVLDVARDARWGRVEETFGEDPHLVGEMGLAAVRGMQGDNQLRDPDRVIATLKHFAAHGQPESGTNCAPVSISERHLREIFLTPFHKAIAEGGAQSVMASYNEIDGVPSHANSWLLRDVLRQEWGFTGTVVSDYYAISELHHREGLFGHHVAADAAAAATAAVRAGVNIELPEPDCYLHLVDLVRRGVVDEEEIDELVAPLLAQKFALGLFESPYVDPPAAEAVVGCEEHRALSLEAARQIITLLKNQSDTLPLQADRLKTIAVIGPNADRVMLGGYSGKPKQFVTVLKAVEQAVAQSVNVLYAEGCAITVGGGWFEDSVVRADEEEDLRKIAEAVSIANQADLVIFVGGGNEQTSREAWSAEHMGDRTDLQLVGKQDELVEALHTTGKPIVSVLFNGRPLAVKDLADRSAALLECWYLGQESGTAVADVLFGRCNPSGKLPITIPRSVGHVPAFYNHRPSARRGYLFDDISPLFPFGFGLSYTRFAFDEPSLSDPVIDTDGSTTVRVRVTNTGSYTGAETVQVYVRDLVSSVTRPVIELKNFKRVTIPAGESRDVELTLTPAELAFWNIDKKLVVEPGEFDVLVGPSSVDLQTVRLRVNPRKR
ncbi:glycoside hydrolase family 3 N-terminal domain-containing protein [Botrimarina hoheduenensis]|uniref:Periplasmic beta-glucosidase n=1 Tax=Botrimarina hoheduenensis TaxID=2528000 RepID=A0A5C5WAK1_9BACT|nr:glycoside hydrolase family 3 N-terminal domain-containing protein [Botrimarina hoheduenensis]TWT47710.1 Periplasmic beta-glucosidase precursor [Botrimarina hoheduenensis]